MRAAISLKLTVGTVQMARDIPVPVTAAGIWKTLFCGGPELKRVMQLYVERFNWRDWEGRLALARKDERLYRRGSCLTAGFANKLHRSTDHV